MQLAFFSLLLFLFYYLLNYIMVLPVCGWKPHERIRPGRRSLSSARLWPSGRCQRRRRRRMHCSQSGRPLWTSPEGWVGGWGTAGSGSVGAGGPAGGSQPVAGWWGVPWLVVDAPAEERAGGRAGCPGPAGAAGWRAEVEEAPGQCGVEDCGGGDLGVKAAVVD